MSAKAAEDVVVARGPQRSWAASDAPRASDAQGASASSSQSGTWWRSVDPSAPATAVLTADGRFLSASTSACALFGLAPGDLLSRTLDAVTHEGDAAIEGAALVQAIDAGGESYELQKRLLHASGESVWVQQRVSITRGEGGRPLHLLWEARPLASIGRGDGTAPDAQEWLRLVVAHAPIVLWCVDARGTFTLAQGRGLEGMGLGTGELVGRSAFGVLSTVRVIEPSGGESTGDALLRRALSGEPCSCLSHVGASTYDTRMAPLFGRGHEVAGVIGVATDVTGLIRAEAALLESQAGFRALIEGSPEIIVIHRGDRVAYVNPSAVTGLGWSGAADLLGRSVLELFHEADRPALAALPEQARPAPELRMVRRDGSTLEVEAVAVPMVWNGGPATAIIARDVSERRQMQARRLSTDRLIALGSLAAGVAHEINNPLTYVVANIELVSQALVGLAREHRGACALVDGEALARRLEGLTGALRSAGDGAGRVRQIVKDLRTFSRTESESRALLDVRSVLEPVIHMAWNEIRHRATFKKHCRDVPLVDANEARLGQVFLNLLLNAAHAIPEGCADANEISVATYTDAQGRAVVEVTDTGGGIAEEHRGRIFDPFFTTKPVGVGTGLGLSICLGTVTSLGGEITVERNDGRGSIFRVALPPAQLDQRRTESRRPSSPSQRAWRARMLIVDDEPLIGESLRMSLSDRHDVRSVTKAREALELLQGGERYDIILCDLMMPDMTGMDLHKVLVRTTPAQAARMVFVTGGAFTHRAREFLDSVPNRRLEKPFELHELTAVISELGPISST